MLKTINVSNTGRNLIFLDTKNNKELTLEQLVKMIENGKYLDYHIMRINGIKTPCSNPDKNKKNNLG